MADKSIEDVLIDIAREYPDFYEKYVIKGDGSIHTLHGGEFATMLIEARIPFTVEYEIEFQATFYVGSDQIDAALKLLMKLRGSKL